MGYPEDPALIYDVASVVNMCEASKERPSGQARGSTLSVVTWGTPGAGTVPTGSRISLLLRQLSGNPGRFPTFVLGTPRIQGPDLPSPGPLLRVMFATSNLERRGNISQEKSSLYPTFYKSGKSSEASVPLLLL